jgi:hypothetical protein
LADQDASHHLASRNNEGRQKQSAAKRLKNKATVISDVRTAVDEHKNSARAAPPHAMLARSQACGEAMTSVPRPRARNKPPEVARTSGYTPQALRKEADERGGNVRPHQAKQTLSGGREAPPVASQAARVKNALNISGDEDARQHRHRSRRRMH